jgi:hypothetical protein
MWKLIGAAGGRILGTLTAQRPIEVATGSLSEDPIIHRNSPFIAMTPRGEALDYDGVSKREVMSELRKDVMYRNFIEAGRSIAGNPNLFGDLRKAIAEGCQDAMMAPRAFEEKIRRDVTADYDRFLQKYREVKARANAVKIQALASKDNPLMIDIKEMLLRPILYTTLALGRFYGVLGTGSLEHAAQLQAKGVISLQVLHLIQATTDYAQSLRLRLHTGARKETDMARADLPVCKACMRNISALMGMADIWIKKHDPNTPLGAPTSQESRRDAFRTTRPLSYDKYNLSLLCGAPGANNRG